MNQDQSSSFTYFQRPNFHNQKRAPKPIVGMHHIKQEAQCSVKLENKQASRSFLLGNPPPNSGSHHQTQQKRLTNSSSNVVQNLTPAFFSQPDAQPYRQIRGGTPQQLTSKTYGNVSQQKLTHEIPDPRLQYISIGNSPPCLEKSKPAIINSFQNFLHNSGVKSNKQNYQSQISQTTKDSHIFEEQIGQLKQDVQSLLQTKLEVNELKERLALAESNIQLLQQSRTHSDHLVDYLQKKIQETEIRTDQQEFYQQEIKHAFSEVIMNGEDQNQAQLHLIDETKTFFQKQVNEINEQIEKEFEDIRSQILQIKPIIQRDLEALIKNQLNQSQIIKFERFNNDLNQYMQERLLPSPPKAMNIDQFRQQCEVQKVSRTLEEIEQTQLMNSINQSDVETLDHSEWQDASVHRNKNQLEQKRQDDHIQQQFAKIDCEQYDIYDSSKHQQQILTQSVDITVDQKIKQLYRCQMSAISEHQMEESCCETANFDYERKNSVLFLQQNKYVEVNNQGFLIDERGQFLLDTQGNQIKLTSQQLQWLRDRNMLEELN